MITDEIIKLYRLTGQSRVKLQTQSELYERSLNGFTDEEKLQIIRDYATFKSNKNYPSIMDLKRFAFNYKKETSQLEEHKEELPPPHCSFKKPELQELFLEVVKKAHISGVAFSPYAKSLGLKLGNRFFMKDGSLFNKIYLWEDKITEAKKQNPSWFEKFKDLDFIEQATLAVYCGFDLVE